MRKVHLTISRSSFFSSLETGTDALNPRNSEARSPLDPATFWPTSVQDLLRRFEASIFFVLTGQAMMPEVGSPV